MIIDWRASPRGADLRPAIVIKDKKGKIGKLSRGGEARYLLPVDAILSVEPGHEVKAGDVLARIPMESAKTRDITGGLPRVAELFEARRPEGSRRSSPRSHGTVQLRPRLQEQAARSPSCRTRTASEPVEYLIPKGKHIRRAGGRPHREGRVHRSTAIRRRTTSWRSRASRSWPTTSSTRSRRSTGCRA